MEPKKIRLGYDPHGNECYCEYNKIGDVLQRLFQDHTVYEQYLSTDSLKEVDKYGKDESWRGDSFTSPLNERLKKTVPASYSEMPPIFLGLYR